MIINNTSTKIDLRWFEKILIYYGTSMINWPGNGPGKCYFKILKIFIKTKGLKKWTFLLELIKLSPI